VLLLIGCGILSGLSLIKAYLVNDDPQAAVFQNLFEQKYQAMRNDVWMRQYDRTERIHVITDSTDWNY
jgi:predicted GIY-YIG superfamily endonuclease